MTTWGAPGSSPALGNTPLGDPWLDPFSDYASMMMPQSMTQALRLVEYTFFSNGTYRQAADRVLSYFLTEVVIDDVGDDEKERWKNFLDQDIDIRNTLHTVGMDMQAYGNSFTSVLQTFRRYLACPRCGNEAPLKKVYHDPSFNFRWEGFEFRASCPRCHYSGEFTRVDRRDTGTDSFSIKRWSPHDIEILWDPYTDDISYIWKIPEDYRRQLRQGHLFHLERVPWEVLLAVKNNNHLLFDEGVIYHMKEDALAGFNNRGWGISRVLSNFKQAWYVQVLHRYNEAIALDYVIPFRLITPAQGDKGAGADPVTNMNLGSFRSQVQGMIRRRRRDPAQWNVLPFPVQYQTLGGDAKQLAPTDLLTQGLEVLLNNIGIPADLFKGSLQVQSAPAALRLFEATWATLPHNLNGFLRFIVKSVSRLLNWDCPTAKLKRVTIADDIELNRSVLQLMMGGQVSPSTGLQTLNINYRDEIQRQIEDQRYQSEMQSKMQKEMEQASTIENLMAQQSQGGGGPPAGGGGPAPSGPSGPSGPAGQAGQAAQNFNVASPTSPNQQITPQDVLQKAQARADQIMQMPPSQRSSELRKLKQTDPLLHSSVMEQIEAIRGQAAAQGKSQVLSQTYGTAH